MVELVVKYVHIVYSCIYQTSWYEQLTICARCVIASVTVSLYPWYLSRQRPTCRTGVCYACVDAELIICIPGPAFIGPAFSGPAFSAPPSHSHTRRQPVFVGWGEGLMCESNINTWRPQSGGRLGKGSYPAVRAYWGFTIPAEKCLKLKRSWLQFDVHKVGKLTPWKLEKSILWARSFKFGLQTDLLEFRRFFRTQITPAPVTGLSLHVQF